jgi:hypothetical protein
MSEIGLRIYLVAYFLVVLSSHGLGLELFT